MKKMRFCSFLAFLAVLAGMTGLVCPVSAEGYQLPEDKTVYAEAALVVHLGLTPEKDTVLFEKEADSIRAPAALVRLMVGAYALKLIDEQNIDIDTATGTYTIDMFNNFVAGTGIGTANMDIGETWTVRDLLTASLMMTAGDAAVTLAATLSPTGKVMDFVRGMNELAEEIGCEHTSFANVTGLGALSQFTTPRDIYRILRYAMDFPEFLSLTGNEYGQYTFHPVKNGKAWTGVTTNSMMRPSTSYYYEPVTYGRTGMTDQGAWNLATLAQQGGYDYIVVVMDCPAKAADGTQNLHYVDTETLCKWVFGQFTYKPLLTENAILAQVKVNLAWSRDKVSLVPKEEFATVVYDQLKSEDIIKKITLYTEEVDAPVEKGTVFGKVELYVNLDQKIGEVELVAGESVERSQILAAWDKVSGFMRSPWFYVGLGLLALLLVGYIILNIVHNRNRRKKNMQKLGRFK